MNLKQRERLLLRYDSDLVRHGFVHAAQCGRGRDHSGNVIWERAALVAEVREAPGRVALLQLDADQPVLLEGSAAAIWLLIDGMRTQSTIVAELKMVFDDADGSLASHVDEFLSVLAAQQLIHPVAPSPAQPEVQLGGGSGAA